MSRRKIRKNSDVLNQLHSGLQTIDTSSIVVNQLGYMIDVEKDHIYDIGYIDDDDYTSMMVEKQEEMEARKIRHKYQGITNDRYLSYENKINNNLKQQSDFYEGKLMPYDLRYSGFGINARSVRQNTGIIETGQEKFKQEELNTTIYGTRDTKKDLIELEYGTMYDARNISFNKPKAKENKSLGGINFSVILEEDIRDTYGLMQGNRKASVVKYVDQNYSNFVDNQLSNAGNNYSGLFQGGYTRRSMLDEIANKGSDGEYMFDMTPHRLELDSYFYDYGLKQMADDVLVDIFDDHDKENDNFLHIQI